MRLLFALAACCVAGCLPTLEVSDGVEIVCDGPEACPPGLVCVSGLDLCRAPDAECVERDGEGYRASDDGSACNLAAGGEGACRSGACYDSDCGDGYLGPGEDCDDGPDNSATERNACRPGCIAYHCGDGVIDSREQCDDGDANSNTAADACRSNCEPAFCGDGVIDDGETCDNGGQNANQGACKLDCSEQRCGDDFVGPGEACDEGGPTATCTADCIRPSCGDAVETGDEDCDEGGPTATCDGNCTPADCRDGTFNPFAGEECDFGDAIDGDGCDSNCTLTACGNGIVTDGEACDLGDDLDGDGCDHDCTLTACGNGIVTAGEDCDDRNLGPGDGCFGCVVEPGFACDDGQPTQCTGICGDGLVRGGEACDDGVGAPNDGCDDACHVDPFYACSGQPSSCVHVWYVNDDAAGANTGASWADAFTTLGAALTAAQAGDQVWLAAGMYRPISSAFIPRSGVQIYGGFGGINETELSQRQPSIHPTILSADRTGDDGPNWANFGNNAANVIDLGGVSDFLFDGLIFEHANQGAIRMNDGISGLTGGRFVDCVIRTSRNNTNGGGANITVSNVLSPRTRFERCRFEGNYAGSNGGGVNIPGPKAKVTFDGCEFVGNQAGGSGGALAGFGTSIIVTASTFTNNSAATGGAIEGDLGISRNRFIGNSATIRAGAISMSGGTHGIFNNLFTGNTAPLASAVHASTGGDGTLFILVVSFNTFTGNTATAPAPNGAFLIGNCSGACVAPTAQVIANLAWGNTGGNIAVQAGASVDGSSTMNCTTPALAAGDIVTNPMVGSDGGRPAGSSALNTGPQSSEYLINPDIADVDDDGDDEETLPVNLSGGPRVVGVPAAHIDIGCQERD